MIEFEPNNPRFVAVLCGEHVQNRHIRDRKTRQIAHICFVFGISVKQFKHLPSAKQAEMHRAYQALMRSRTPMAAEKGHSMPLA